MSAFYLDLSNVMKRLIIDPMSKTFTFKTFLLVSLGVVLVLLIVGVHTAHSLYLSIFRLSPGQVASALRNTTPECTTIASCQLLPGDLLIRRYITKRTWIVDKVAHPYFTHTAFYLGNGELVEAVGEEKNPADEIRISQLASSDWLDRGLESWVIVRPNKYLGKLEKIRATLIGIAEDPAYQFGLPSGGVKRASCADLIYHPLVDAGVLPAATTTSLTVTPDYLFWTTVTHPGDFQIIGYAMQN